MAKRFGKVNSYEEWLKPKLVSNVIELLDKEIPKLIKKITSVQLCFTTDPFMYGYQEIADSSMQIIAKLNSAGIRCMVLTKGLLPSNLASFSPENEYGITLISLDEKFRKKIEPNAAPYSDRIKSLRTLHDNGTKTWVSIEPYPTPNIIEQDIYKLLNAISFVDKIIFGRTNYNSVISQYPNCKEFYNEMSNIVVNFCNENDIQYHIKNGTISSQNK
jgi:DNA repair photolyase